MGVNMHLPRVQRTLAVGRDARHFTNQIHIYVHIYIHTTRSQLSRALQRVQHASSVHPISTPPAFSRPAAHRSSRLEPHPRLLDRAQLVPTQRSPAQGSCPARSFPSHLPALDENRTKPNKVNLHCLIQKFESVDSIFNTRRTKQVSK